MVVVMVMMKMVMGHGNDDDIYLMIHDVHNLYYYRNNNVARITI